MAEQAAIGESFTAPLAELERRHFGAVKELMEVQAQNPVFTRLKIYFNELEDLLQGLQPARANPANPRSGFKLWRTLRCFHDQ